MAISCAELPFPEPIALFARSAQQPMKTFQPRWHGRYEAAKSDGNERRYPGAVMIVSREDRPASVRVLCVKKKILSTF
jgi:hypothetical protein